MSHILRNGHYRADNLIMVMCAHCVSWRCPECVDAPGAVNELPNLLKKAGIRKPLVVTDPGLVKAGIASAVMKILADAGVDNACYDRVVANPTVSTVTEVKDAYVAGSCDGFVAVGGGSSMDATKGAAVMLARPDREIGQMSGYLHVRKKLRPMIAVPTTAGTGSETTIAAVISDPATHQKYAIMDPVLIPDYAIHDADLTVGLPPSVTSTTGLDALAHAVEAFVSWTGNTSDTRRWAEDATRLVFENLERAYTDGHDLEARENMLRASYEAGLAFTRVGVGNIHAIAHALGGKYNIAHGLAVSVVMPKVLADYVPEVNSKLARLAEAIGLTADSDAELAAAFVRKVTEISTRLDIPEHLDCIVNEDLDSIADTAYAEANPGYPVPVVYDRERFVAMIRQVAGKS